MSIFPENSFISLTFVIKTELDVYASIRQNSKRKIVKSISFIYTYTDINFF